MPIKITKLSTGFRVQSYGAPFRLSPTMAHALVKGLDEAPREIPLGTFRALEDRGLVSSRVPHGINRRIYSRTIFGRKVSAALQNQTDEEWDF